MSRLDPALGGRLYSAPANAPSAIVWSRDTGFGDISATTSGLSNSLLNV